MRSSALLQRERSRLRRPEPEPPPHEHPLLALQRGAGNQAVAMLLRTNGKTKGKAKGRATQAEKGKTSHAGKGKTSPAQATAPTALTEKEKADKVRILTDYVWYTPAAELTFGEWQKPPKTQDEYVAALLEKIRASEDIKASLKSQEQMKPVREDDDWGDHSYNVATLRQVVKDTWGKPAPAKVGKDWAPFNKHDCVFAAITHVLGFGDDLKTDIKLEQALADALHHRYGEVEDSILYRMMEKLQWPYVGKFQNWQAFLASAGTATYIVSENKDTSGASGHVIVAEPDGATEIGKGAKYKIYDRQQHRFASGGRQDPRFEVYAWRVETGTDLAQAIMKTLAGVK